MPSRSYNSRRTYRRKGPIRYNRRRRRIPNVNQVGFFTPRNLYTAARYAVKGVNLMKGIINSELKRYDVSVNPTATSTASYTLLSGIDQGDDANQRSGNQVLAKYLMYNISATISASATATHLRVIIFIDTDNDGETPTTAELLQQVGATTQLTSPINIDNTGRFTILADVHMPLSINGDRILVMKGFKKLNYHQKFLTATGSTGFGKGSIWAYVASNEGTNPPTVILTTREGYYDN